MSDVEQLCSQLNTFGVSKETITLARKDLAAHADEELNWLQLAAHLRRTGHFDASLETYETAARRFPSSARLWNNRGVLLREHGHLDKAIASFERALELKPDYVHAIESIAIAYEKLQVFSVASDFYKQALSLDEDRPLCWNNLGNCRRMQGLNQEAIACYQQAIRRDPQHANAMFNLASMQYEQKEFADALCTIERCAALTPSDPAIRSLRNEILAQPDNPKQCVPSSIPGFGYVFRLSTTIDEHGRTIEPDLTSDLIVSSDDILAMSREDAARVAGFRAWDILHLERLVQEALHQSDPPPKGFSVPFISYRWGDHGHSEWVLRFVRDLEQRGYDVVFDRNAETELTPPTAPDLIARMTRCNLFVAMLTNRYTRRVLVSPDPSAPVDDGWRFDEWRIGEMLWGMQRLGFIGIWVSGDDLPPPFSRNNVCDFRNQAQYTDALDRIFPFRYVTIMGIKPDKSVRTLTHVKRSESKEAIARFQASKEFEHIAIVENPTVRGDKTGA